MEAHTGTMNNLSETAKEFYFKKVSVEKYRENFLLELEKRTVIDKRDLGYFCSYCGKFAEKHQAFEALDQVIFPKGNNTELWLVNTHYDGCRGWD
jgi:hypothetical protein